MTPLQRARFIRGMPRVDENPLSTAFFATAKGRRRLGALERRYEIEAERQKNAALRRAELEEARLMYHGVESIGQADQ